jgi:SWI/SNF-related matrix-associated actin-dependent regulator of chromatin subfamily D
MISKSDLAFAYRKAPIVPPQHAGQQQYNNASVQAQQRAEAERREKMRRTARNPTDKNIPEGVEDVCIGDGVVRYKELREVERTLDATMMRKKLDVMDSKHHSRASRYGTMRVWISNTVENQPWQSTGIDADAFDFESNTNPTYRVKIQGRLLDDEGDEGLEDDEEDQDADAMDSRATSRPSPSTSTAPRACSPTTSPRSSGSARASRRPQRTSPSASSSLSARATRTSTSQSTCSATRTQRCVVLERSRRATC